MGFGARGDSLEADAPGLRGDDPCRHNSSRKSVDRVRLACPLHRGKFAAQGALVDLLTGLIDRQDKAADKRFFVLSNSNGAMAQMPLVWCVTLVCKEHMSKTTQSTPLHLLWFWCSPCRH